MGEEGLIKKKLSPEKLRQTGTQYLLSVSEYSSLFMGRLHIHDNKTAFTTKRNAAHQESNETAKESSPQN